MGILGVGRGRLRWRGKVEAEEEGEGKGREGGGKVSGELRWRRNQLDVRC